MSSGSNRPPARSRLAAGLLGLVLFLAIASLVIVVAISWNRIFHIDEIEGVHAGFNIRSGQQIYSDFIASDPPLLYALLSVIIDPEKPAVSFHRARLVSLCILLCTLILTALVARQIGGTMTAILSTGLLLLHSTFIERGIEVRPHGAVAMCTMLSMLLVYGRREVLVRSCLQAVILGLSLLLSPIAIVPTIAFGCLWLTNAKRKRRGSLALLPVVVLLLPATATLGLFAKLGNVGGLVESYFGSLRGAHLDLTIEHAFPAKYALMVEWGRNRFFTLAAIVGAGALLGAIVKRGRLFLIAGGLAGLSSLFFNPFPHGFFLVGGVVVSAYLLASWAAMRLDSEGLRFPSVLAAIALVAVWAHPFPYPYLHLLFLPPLSLIAGHFLARVHAMWPSGSRPLARLGFLLVCFGLSGASSLPRLLDQARYASRTQLATLEEVQRITNPDDRIFDMVGLYFRPDAHPAFHMKFQMFKMSEAGRYPRIIAALRKNETVAIILNNRTNWLKNAERRFLAEHFTHYAGNIFLQGVEIEDLKPGEERRFEVLKEKLFNYSGPPFLRIDGKRFRRGRLRRGRHVLTADREIHQGKLIMATPAPFPALLGRAALLFPSFN